MSTSVADFLVKSKKMEQSGIKSEYILDFFDYRDALADGMSVYQDKDNPHHYKFDFFPVDQFNDCMMEEIAEALRESTKATEITLFHGNVTDKGMKKFIDALRETKAPIKSLHIMELQKVTDDSMRELAEVIREKGITNCELGLMKGVSQEVAQEIANACKQESSVKINEVKEKLKNRPKLEGVSGVVVADRIAEKQISGEEKRVITPKVGKQLRKSIMKEVMESKKQTTI